MNGEEGDSEGFEGLFVDEGKQGETAAKFEDEEDEDGGNEGEKDSRGGAGEREEEDEDLMKGEGEIDLGSVTVE